jgi:hypothetical protein
MGGTVEPRTTPLELRRSSPRRGVLGDDPELEQLIRPASERRLLCRRCGAAVTSDDHRISIGGRHVHRRVNPAGIEFEFGCFDEAPGAVVAGQPVAEFSWFPGYTWAYSLCWQCGAHLGWLFEGRDPRFHGLVLNRLEEEKPETG